MMCLARMMPLTVLSLDQDDMIAARPRTPNQACLLDPLGTIGRGTLGTLTRRRHAVVCFARTRLAGARIVDCLETRLVEWAIRSASHATSFAANALVPWCPARPRAQTRPETRGLSIIRPMQLCSRRRAA